MPLIHRAARAVRQVAPYLYLAAIGCFLAAMCIGFSLILDDRTIADRLLVACGWAGFGGVWFVSAYLSEHYA